MDSEYPPQPPEGRLLEEAANADGRSVRQLAANAGISDTRWRHIVRGYQPTGGKQFTVVRAPAVTLAKMAHAVGLDPEDLERVGRGDASQYLAGLQATRERHEEAERTQLPTSAVPETHDEIDLIYSSRTMTAQEKLEAIRKVLHLRAQAEEEASPMGGASSSDQQVRNGGG